MACMFLLEMSPIPLRPCLLLGTRENHREHLVLVGPLQHFFVCVLPLEKKNALTHIKSQTHVEWAALCEVSVRQTRCQTL